MSVEGNVIELDLPVLVPELTLRLTDGDIQGVSVDGKPLAPASSRTAFKSGTFYTEDGITFAAFDPTKRDTTVEIQTPA